jgi:inner membrane protein
MENNANQQFGSGGDWGEQERGILGVFQRNRVTIKGLLVGFMVLLLLIPVAFVLDLVHEREQRQTEVREEISSKWAHNQHLAGPLLEVPYENVYVNQNGKTVTEEKLAYFLPEQLTVKADIQPRPRKRGNYEAILYQSKIHLEGKFSSIPVSSVGLQESSLKWEKAKLRFSISDMRGLEQQATLQMGNKSAFFVPDIHPSLDGKGLSLELSKIDSTPASIRQGFGFAIQLSLKGSSSLFVTPTASNSSVFMTSSWKHPSFDGDFLPSSDPVISDSGFQAKWTILAQNAGLPAAWKDEKISLTSSSMGVRLLQPNDGYSRTIRAAKYGILFIGLSFGIFFFLELRQKKQVHPVQYLLVGLSLVVFYTLLLSISEILHFNLAYIIAATATISLIGIYVYSVFDSKKVGFLFSGVLLALYSFMFFLLSTEEHSLLIGSVGIFCMVGLFMYLSRRVNWNKQ